MEQLHQEVDTVTSNVVDALFNYEEDLKGVKCIFHFVETTNTKPESN